MDFFHRHWFLSQVGILCHELRSLSLLDVEHHISRLVGEDLWDAMLYISFNPHIRCGMCMRGRSQPELPKAAALGLAEPCEPCCFPLNAECQGALPSWWGAGSIWAWQWGRALWGKLEVSLQCASVRGCLLLLKPRRVSSEASSRQVGLCSILVFLYTNWLETYIEMCEKQNNTEF